MFFLIHCRAGPHPLPFHFCETPTIRPTRSAIQNDLQFCRRTSGHGGTLHTVVRHCLRAQVVGGGTEIGHFGREYCIFQCETHHTFEPLRSSMITPTPVPFFWHPYDTPHTLSYPEWPSVLPTGELLRKFHTHSWVTLAVRPGRGARGRDIGFWTRILHFPARNPPHV